MAENLLLTLLWGWPVLLGLFVWLAKVSYAVQSMDRLEVWLAYENGRIVEEGFFGDTPTGYQFKE